MIKVRSTHRFLLNINTLLILLTATILITALLITLDKPVKTITETGIIIDKKINNEDENTRHYFIILTQNGSITLETNRINFELYHKNDKIKYTYLSQKIIFIKKIPTQ